MDDSLFIPASFFMIRTPILPFSDFLSFFHNQNGQTSISHLPSEIRTIVCEAIAIASTSLYHMVQNKKENQQTRSSLLKYFSRMTTRSTPFGIFSFVSIGSWGNTNAISFDLNKIKKRVRPDMEWLLSVIETFHLDPNIQPFLTLRRNPLLFQSTGRICLSYYLKKKESEDSKMISIRSSFLAQAILEMTAHPIAFTELIKKLMMRYPHLMQEKIENLVKQLLKEQYLNYTLHPSLLTESPFHDLLNQLSSLAKDHREIRLDLTINQLEKIRLEIDHYHQTRLGQGEDSLLDLQIVMKKMNDTQHVIQVDSTYPHTQNHLSYQISQELGKAAEVLWILANDYFEYPLKSYHEKFLEKYGIHRMVSLVNLLHEEEGLGVPDHYLNLPLEKMTKPHTKSQWNQWLKNQWIHALRNGISEIELTETQLAMLLEKKNGDIEKEKSQAPPSIDLFCEMIADSTEKINEGEYLISIVNASWQGGATLGRFLDALGEKVKENVQQFYLEEESLEKESLFAQSSYPAYRPRHANVAIHPKLRRHAIDIGGSETIKLQDIYVGATHERLYLTLKGSHSELIVTADHMLNNALAPIPIRFIREVSYSRYRHILPFSWFDLYDSPFLPRVRFKKFILFQAQWKVDFIQLGISGKENTAIIQERFQAWAVDWKMPRYIFMGEGDQRILLDRENPNHMYELVNVLKKGNGITLTEKIGQEKGQWVKSDRGLHLSEFVIPLIKNKKYGFPSHHFPASSLFPAITLDQRCKLLGSDWLFAKCYVSMEQENCFLVNYFQQFAHHILEHKVVNDCFFIRYADPKPHLRLRFHGNKDQLITKFLPAFHDWTHQLMSEKCIREMIFSGYEREIERYGGDCLIDFAEALFCADSKTSISLLNAQLKKKIGLSPEVIAALSLIDFLLGMEINLSQQIDFFAQLKLNKSELAGFREQKIHLISHGQALLNHTLVNHSEDGAELSLAFQYRKEALRTFACKMREELLCQKLTMPISAILDSLLHMHCNRLLGRDHKQEMKVRLYTYQTLNAIKEKMRHVSNN